MYLIAPAARLRSKAGDWAGAGGESGAAGESDPLVGEFGFALLTVGIVDGAGEGFAAGPKTTLGPHWMTSPKVVLAFTVLGGFMRWRCIRRSRRRFAEKIGAAEHCGICF